MYRIVLYQLLHILDFANFRGHRINLAVALTGEHFKVTEYVKSTKRAN
jgi:hypothetical protein